MRRAKIEYLVSLLKYIDIEFMTDEEADSIYDAYINNEKDQREVIRKLIVPGFKIELECSKEVYEMYKNVIKLAIKDSKKTNKLFNGMSFPFEEEIEDKDGFLKIMYEELFGEELVIEE